MTSDLLQYIMKRNIMIHSMKKRTPTTLEYALLGLVHAEPRSGYDLCKVFETTPMGHYSSSPGAIYPALKRLEGAGLVEGKVEKAGSLRPRKKFLPVSRWRPSNTWPSLKDTTTECRNSNCPPA